MVITKYALSVTYDRVKRNPQRFSRTMEKRSNFNARERSVFEITRADLSSCDLLSIYMYRYARSKDNDEDEDERRTNTRTTREESCTLVCCRARAKVSLIVLH